MSDYVKLYAKYLALQKQYITLQAELGDRLKQLIDAYEQIIQMQVTISVFRIGKKGHGAEPKKEE